MSEVILESYDVRKTKWWYRCSVASFYFISGLVFASWASRIPDVKNNLGMNDAVLGGVLFFIPMGQMSAMALSGWLVSKYGSKRAMLCASIFYPTVLMFLGLSSSVWALSACLFMFGMAANLFNISVNTQAVGVERLYGTSIMASFHGLWSLAGFIGGVISSLMVAAYIDPFPHFCIIFLLSLVIIFTMKGSALPRDKQRKKSNNQKKKTFTPPSRYILVLGFMAFGSMVCEGTMFDWSSIYFEDVIQPSKNLVRLGYIAAMFSMAGGRFIADRFIIRFGVANVLKVSGTIIFLGLVTATVFPHIITATIGFLLLGLGVSSVVPITYSLAGKSKVMSPGVAIATVSTIGFLGFLLGPPVIGFVAHGIGLRWALGIISVFGLFIVALSPQLKKPE